MPHPASGGPPGAAGGAAGGAVAADAIVPAQLGFLAIYNPSLGTTDETVEDQIVYYWDGSSGSGGGGCSSGDRNSTDDTDSAVSNSSGGGNRDVRDVRNERLRQIGLAQGMVAFGRSFAGDQAVDTIETAKTRVVLHELEPGWWLLASVDLTRLPLPSTSSASASSPGAEYSSREVKPAPLLLQDLLRAHAVFLLHHAASLSQLYARLASPSSAPAPSFQALLARYWDVFLPSWSVLLHGNPVRDMLPGVRLAACGELGIGVGEEDRGSGERAVLEGLVAQTPGLVDLVLCRYGDEEPGEQEEQEEEEGGHGDAPEEGDGHHGSPWLGTGRGLGAEDGAVFLGVGALTRPAVRSLTYWLEDIYSWGADAYGVAENPSLPAATTKTGKRRKTAAAASSEATRKQRRRQQQQPPERQRPPPPLLPPAPVTQLAARRAKQPTPPTAAAARDAPTTDSGGHRSSVDGGGIDKYMSYMKLGFGTYWHLGGAGSDAAAPEGGQPRRQSGPARPGEHVRSGSAGTGSRPRRQLRRTPGEFLIGLTTGGTAAAAAPRTVVVELAPSRTTGERSSQETIRRRTGANSSDTSGSDADTGSEAGGDRPQQKQQQQQQQSSTETLRVVVYAQRPFLYACLFRLPTVDAEAQQQEQQEQDKQAELLLSRQLGFLHRSLLSSTAYRPDKPGVSALEAVAPGASAGRMYDLVWDPNALTIQSTIPNIPEPGVLAEVSSSNGALYGGSVRGRKSKAATKQRPPLLPPPPAAWSRAEALSAHMQILHLYAATRANGAELERMCKTSRGWWIVWNRVVERGGRPVGRQNKQYGGSSDEEEEEDYDDGGNNDDDDGSDDGNASDDTARAPSVSVASTAAVQDYTVSKEIFLLRRASDRGDRFDRFESAADQATRSVPASAASAAAAAQQTRAVSSPSTVAAAAAAAATAATAATVRVFSPSTYLGLAGRMGAAITGDSGNIGGEGDGIVAQKENTVAATPSAAAAPSAASASAAAAPPERAPKMFTFDGLLSRK